MNTVKTSLLEAQENTTQICLNKATHVAAVFVQDDERRKYFSLSQNGKDYIKKAREYRDKNLKASDRGVTFNEEYLLLLMKQSLQSTKNIGIAKTRAKKPRGFRVRFWRKNKDGERVLNEVFFLFSDYDFKPEKALASALVWKAEALKSFTNINHNQINS